MKQHNILLKRFVLLALLSMVFILTLATIGIYKIYQNNIINNAIYDALAIGNVIIEQEHDLLIAKDTSGRSYWQINPNIYEVLNQRMQKYLFPLGIFKIKVFSMGMKVVYSTEEKLIGKADANNLKLAEALKGKSIGEYMEKSEKMDLKDEKGLDRDVVEVYYPVKTKENEIIGGAEVYVDVTRYSEEIKNTVVYSGLVLLGVLLIAFGALHNLMKISAKRLELVQRRLEEVAITDELTKLYNRRLLISRAEEEFSKGLRLLERVLKHNLLSLIMVDIDHFKYFNDTYGHQIGDEILKEFSIRLQNSVRNYDVVGRWGGEEFLILLPSTDLENAQIVAQRVWKQTREKPFEIQGLSYDVKISLGIACATKNDQDFNSVLKRADDGLYLAKNNGRDQIAIVPFD
ncbi:MAG: diguanylate cyclase [Desulfitobacteriaceae bacterium]